MRTRTLAIIAAVQAAAVTAAAFGYLEKEVAFFVTGALACWLALRPLEEGLAVFIVSLPFVFALPVSDAFDSMAAWRILSVVLTLRWLVEEAATGGAYHALQRLLRQAWRSPLFWLACIWVGWSALSTVAAAYPGTGARKVAFLVNILALYPIVRAVLRRPEGVRMLRGAAYVAFASVLAVGFLQQGSLFVTSLERFWRFWAGQVIPLFYGYTLGELLQTSNTWFSFGGDGPPLLRMFSVFPDSHSFSLFMMLGAAGASAQALAAYREGRQRTAGWWVAAIGVAFLGLVLSGSRGVWLAAGGAALLTLLAAGILRVRHNAPRAFTDDLVRLGLLFLLLVAAFVPATLISSLAQRAQGARGDTLAAVKRVKSITDLEEVSNRSRIQIWKAALAAVEQSPVWGVGIGNFSVALGEDIATARRGASAHNLYLDIASESGIPALLAFLGLVLLVLWRAACRAWRGMEGASFGAAFLVYGIWILGYSVFDVVLFNDKVFIAAVMVAAAAISPDTHGEA